MPEIPAVQAMAQPSASGGVTEVPELVPEPSTLALAGLGELGLLLFPQPEITRQHFHRPRIAQIGLFWTCPINKGILENTRQLVPI
jgi:hypothetical protein